MLSTSLSRLRTVGIIEGISFLTLLLIAMPLKYAFDLPMAVKVVGWIHGVLFILFCVVYFQAMLDVSWPLLKRVKVFISALIPFGFIIIDRNLKDESSAELASSEQPS